MSTAKPQTSIEKIRVHNPRLADFTTDLVLEGIWEDKTLSKRDRSLITVTALVALYRGDQLKWHLRNALSNGVTKDEINALMVHLAFYAGWPTGMSGALAAKDVFEES